MPRAHENWEKKITLNKFLEITLLDLVTDWMSELRKKRAAEDDSQISAWSEWTTSVNVNWWKEEKNKFRNKGDDFSFGYVGYKDIYRISMAKYLKCRHHLSVLGQRFTLEATNSGVISKYIVGKATNLLDIINQKEQIREERETSQGWSPKWSVAI